MSERDQEGKTTAIYDVERDLHYYTETARKILQSFLKNGLIEPKPPEKGRSLRNRIPYALTPIGKQLEGLMDHLRKENMISDDKDKDVDLHKGFRQDMYHTLKLDQAGFSIENWERAISCGLITEKRRTVTRLVYGQAIDPSEPHLPVRMRFELYSYSFD